MSLEENYEHDGKETSGKRKVLKNKIKIVVQTSTKDKFVMMQL